MTDAPSGVTFEAFTATVLDAWSPSAELHGDTYTTPRSAAMRAAYEASVVHKTRGGTVLIAAREDGPARECVRFLHSFYTDQPHLNQSLKKATPDGVELAGGRKITVTTDDTKRPSRLLACLKLDVTSVDLKQINNRDLARTILHVWATYDEAEEEEKREEFEAFVEAAIKRPGWFDEIRAQAKIRHAEEELAWEARKAAHMQNLRRTTTSVPQVGRANADGITAAKPRIDDGPRRDEYAPVYDERRGKWVSR